MKALESFSVRVRTSSVWIFDSWGNWGESAFKVSLPSSKLILGSGSGADAMERRERGAGEKTTRKQVAWSAHEENRGDSGE